MVSKLDVLSILQPRVKVINPNASLLRENVCVQSSEETTLLQELWEVSLVGQKYCPFPELTPYYCIFSPLHEKLPPS